MKPLLLHGHDRPITQIKYNREGDLLFSASKAHVPNVWYSVNGERLGTFIGHQGAVWTIDVDWKTARLMSGSADQYLKIWDCETGNTVGSVMNGSSVRTSSFSYSSNMAVYSTEPHFGLPCEIIIIDVRNADNSIGDQNPILKIPILKNEKVTALVWGIMDETVITGHEDGKIRQWDIRDQVIQICEGVSIFLQYKNVTSLMAALVIYHLSPEVGQRLQKFEELSPVLNGDTQLQFQVGKERLCVSDHSDSINDMQLNKDGTMFITASRDNTAKLFDTDKLEFLKCFKTERPINSAAISPIKDHVVLGGGQDAGEVTTTSTRSGKFESRFFHLVFEEEFGRVKGHFGPINSVAFHPDGKSFSTGGEDGYVRIQSFDQPYFDFSFDC